MLKKIDHASQFIENHLDAFLCPVCQQSFFHKGYSLVCKKNHQFDLSKKGTLYFLSHLIQTEYNKKMLMHRGLMIRSGMYAPVLEKIVEMVEHKDANTLDVGCGEGSFLLELAKLGIVGPKFGFDISKDGIYLASNHEVEAFWSVADLTNLPFADNSMDTLLTIFAPSHYREFDRVLKKDGSAIKVIPETNYLKELRVAFYPENQQKQEYSNEKVKVKFAEEMNIEKEERISYTYEIPENRRLDLLEMSPLEWQTTAEIKRSLQQNPLEKITIDVCVLKGKKKNAYI